MAGAPDPQAGPPPPGPDSPKKASFPRREAKRRFLEALARTQCVRKAAKFAGRSRPWFYVQRTKDQRFRDRWNGIVANRDALLEDTGYSLAVNGAREPILHLGVVRAWKRKYFPRLIMDLLRASNPAKYGRALIPADEVVADVEERHAAMRALMRQMETSVQGPPDPSPGPAAPTPAVADASAASPPAADPEATPRPRRRGTLA